MYIDLYCFVVCFYRRQKYIRTEDVLYVLWRGSLSVSACFRLFQLSQPCPYLERWL